MSAVEANGGSILAFDALGCGNSAKPRSHAAYHPDELFRDLVEVHKIYSQACNLDTRSPDVGRAQINSNYALMQIVSGFQHVP